jgi:hypothetical protein
VRKEFYDGNQIMKNYTDYWIDLIGEELGCYTDIEDVKRCVKNLVNADLLKILSINNTGVFAYVIAPDFLGGRALSEVVFYIRKEERGNLRLFKRYLSMIEAIAKKEHCGSVKIGGNIGYKDQSFLTLLKRFGYVDDTVAKYLT